MHSPNVNGAWSAVIRAATLGTERDPNVTAITGDVDLDALYDDSNSIATPEAAILRRAAVLSAAVRAGRRPIHLSSAPPVPAPCETLPPCPSAAARDLAELLTVPQMPLLFEWFDLCKEFGRRVPHELIPQLLELGRANADLRARLAAILGSRGIWLAAQNSRWHWLTDRDDPRRAFQEGVLVERCVALRTMRSIDAGFARHLLAGSWIDEPPDARAQLLKSLDVNLSDDDEPFLEAALNDRRLEVRMAAAALLAALPRSGLVARMTALADDHIAFSNHKLCVIPPNELTRAMQRDGILAKHPDHAVGNIWWLEQILERVPPTHWRQRFEATSAEVVALFADNEFSAELLNGLAHAAATFRDSGVADAFLNALTMRPDFVSFAQASLTGNIDPTCINTLADVLAADTQRAIVLLDIVPPPWSEDFSTAALDALRRQTRHLADYDSFNVFRARLFAAAARMVPTEAACQEWILPSESKRWSPAIDEFCEYVRHRQRIRSNFETAHRQGSL